ncbi:hypothetical protein GCWU000282_01575 [Catonella morbi ATCC 51271]|uniref:Uncharacterized protein n=1 Tax=Catonella morbi ATCC 51271 TaxID=592026 RepID=V2Z711_9FIRM|nr:hypothetical protein GCWU000282_01575 [Catonella morbi ATCC 51271]
MLIFCTSYKETAYPFWTHRSFSFIIDKELIYSNKSSQITAYFVL